MQQAVNVSGELLLWWDEGMGERGGQALEGCGGAGGAKMTAFETL